MKKLLTYFAAVLAAVLVQAQPTPAQGVGRIIAGTNITITPTSGTGGAVTINSTGGGLGTVTTVSVVPANGVSGTVATATTTPAITLALGDITPSSISIGADPADAGDIRLVNAGLIAWEASPAGTDVTLSVNSSEQFVFSNTILSPDFTTSVTTSSTSFTAWAGATTLLTLGGTGASASLFAPSTLDATSSTTGAIRTSGGISAAKAANFGTTLTIGGQLTSTVVTGTAPLVVASTTQVANLNAATAGTATNATNVATTSTTTNALFYPLFVASSSNGNQAASLLSTFTINPSTGNIVTPGTLTTGSGSGASGIVTINGLTSGKTVYTTADATAQTVTITTAAQTVGAVGLTVPNFAGVNDTYTFNTLAATLANKTLTSPVISTGLTASGSAANTLAGSSGTFITSTGLNTLSGATTLAPAARATGIASYWTVTTPADTNMTASTESIGANWAAATRQWATGALTTQREHVYAAPTYGFVGASTLTTAVNVDIADPIAGTNATITNKYGLRVNNQQVTGTLTANTGTNLLAPFVDSVDGTTPLNNINQVVATGTAYTMTNAYASLDFGTTDPILTIANAGTYAVYVDVQLNLVGATYATYDSATIKLRRTNNTAADLTGSTFGTFIPTITTITAVGPYLHVGPIKYQTSNTNDTITVQGVLGTTPAAGSVTATACTITAIRAY